MTMFFRGLFAVAALYDGILGAAFLVAAPAIFDAFDVTGPNHVGYVQFPAALLIIFALMFASIAIAPHRRRHLILYGMLLKLSYSGLVFYHWATGGVSAMWKPFAIADLVFLGLFAWAYVQLRPGTGVAPEE